MPPMTTDAYDPPKAQEGQLFDDLAKTIKIDATKTIRFISVKVRAGVLYDGIRFFGENMESIVDVEWGLNDFGSWTNVQEVPSGRKIVGLKSNV